MNDWPSLRVTLDRIDEYLTSCRAAGLSPRTLEAYAWALAKLPDAALTTPSLERVLASCKLAAESRWDLFKAWKTFFRWAAGRFDAQNPLAGVRAPRRLKRLPKTIPWPTIQRLLFLAQRNPVPQLARRDAALLLLLLDTGLRLGELHALEPAAVGPATIRVAGKGGRERAVPISAHVRLALLGVLPWQSVHGDRLSRRGLQEVIRRLYRAAGVAGAGPHRLRHTMAVQYLMGGGDLVSLQRILGHADLTTTRLYLELDTRDVERQHARFSPALRLVTPEEHQKEYVSG